MNAQTAESSGWHLLKKRLISAETAGKRIWEDGQRRKGLDPIKVRLERRREKARRAKRVCSWVHEGKRIGITQKVYDEALRIQGGVCAACKKPESIVNTRLNKLLDLAADHCHKTGRFRGLLCGRCNRGLGYLLDDLETLRNLVLYLENPVDYTPDYIVELRRVLRRGTPAYNAVYQATNLTTETEK